MPHPADPARARRWLWLLVLPLVALTCVPSYSKIEPTLFDFPFFYWYKLAWVFGSALITAVVYYKTRGCWSGEQRKEAGK